jgi:hypothetical protein
MTGTNINVPSAIRLPPIEVFWPWPRAINAHLVDIEQECLDWSASFGAFDAETHKVIHDHGKFSIFAPC